MLMRVKHDVGKNAGVVPVPGLEQCRDRDGDGPCCVGWGSININTISPTK